MIRVFIGFDHRQPVSYQVLHHSIMRRASEPIAITPLFLPQLPINRQGLTPFTYSRYLVPWLCAFEGFAIFMDADMLCLCDIAELRDHAFQAPVACRKFEGALAFERPSLMVFDCGRVGFAPQDLEREPAPQSICFQDDVHALPEQYNRLVGYEDCSDAKILHYTAGVPVWDETRALGYCEPWEEEFKAMTGAAPYAAIMGQSVHNQNLGIGNG